MRTLQLWRRTGDRTAPSASSVRSRRRLQLVVNSTSETDGIGKSKPASSGGRCQAREASTGDRHPAEVVTGMRKEVDYG